MKIKKVIKKVAENVFQSSWYPNKKIILESIPDLSSQTYPVFKYMLEQHLNDEYKLIWWVTDKDDYKNIKIKNVVFRDYSPESLLGKLRKNYELCTSRAMLNATRYIGKYFDRQYYFYLMHGACIKSRLKHTRDEEINDSDGSICLSPFLRKYDVIEEHISEEKLAITGYPRNDYLFVDDKEFCKKVLGNHYRDYTILWMPTFRKSKDGTRIDSYYNFPLGVPCIYSKEECENLNEILMQFNTTLVIKPHPVQNISILKDLNLSNIVFIYDCDIERAEIQLYQFLGATDALITDYSSVYYDYLLTKKKIGVTIDDIDEYAKTTGFVFENPLDILKGKYIKDVNDFIDFIQYVVSSEDLYLEQREEICNLVHTYQDNQSTKRVYDYIISELEQRYGTRRKVK